MTSSANDNPLATRLFASIQSGDIETIKDLSKMAPNLINESSGISS